MLTALLLLLLHAFQTTGSAAPLQVAVILNEEGPAYREFTTVLREQLGQSSYTLTVADTESAVDGADLYLAVGMKAVNRLARSGKPVLGVLVPRAGVEAVRTSAMFSAIYIEQPLKRQLALLSAALPHARSFGVMYATPPAELAELKQLAAASGLVLQTEAVPEPSQLSASLSVLLEKSDALLVLPDVALYRPDTIRNILLETYGQRVPMIGLSRNYVRAGALCAVYSTPAQIARQAARTIEFFTAHGRLPPSQYPEEFEVSVNTRVARSLGLTIKDAAQLRASIGER
ncbi:MAG: hypothetical protein Fur0026_10460 [Sideroxydans sp.]